ncbi:unnamed protein product [Periconia digitata]|uniref:acetylglutamate kinase n=1 Tax=Periconia digitata TaxID=1303443 RepID=A0A9W4U2T4_9PLEO|nr:unnamed protein product [Periconia digitata]
MQGIVRAGAKLAARARPPCVAASSMARSMPRALATTTIRRYSDRPDNHDASSMRSAFLSVLGSVSSRREIDQYLAQFRSVSSQQFAVVKVGGAVLTDHIDTLCNALQHLYAMGLYPIIVHGAGPQMNKLLQDAGVEPEFIDGIRVTDKKTLGVARKLFLKTNMDLVMRLRVDYNIPARPITAGVLQADYRDKEKWKYVGDITSIDSAPIIDALKAKQLPIICSMAETEDGQILNVNADVAAGELARALEPLKIVYLSEKGGLVHGETGKLISTINLDEEYDTLMQQSWVKFGTKLKIVEVKKLLDDLPKTSSVAIIHPQYLEKELFTHTGGGTLIRKGESIQSATKLEDIEDIRGLREALLRDRESLDSGDVIDRFLNSLKDRQFEAFYDNTMGAVAVVFPPSSESGFAQLATFTTSKDAFLTNIADNIFERMKKKYPKMYWTVETSDENLGWFKEKADGTLRRGKENFCFWGSANQDEAFSLMSEFSQQGKAMFGNQNLESQLRRAADYAASLKHGQQARAYSTMTPGLRTMRQSVRPSIRPSMKATASRGFATSASRSIEDTNPNPPYGLKFKSKDWPSKIALIGARGYTGQALIDLLNRHPNMDLRHVSSRELAGKKLEGYTKRNITYENLSPEDVSKMAEKGEVDCWVMALPNGVCKPFVDAINDAGKPDSVIVDLSADYRFDSSWTYGLPELVDRRKISDATRIANPGCYATAAQLGIAPLLEFIGGQPTVFGVSGYSGAGTKPSPKNDVKNLENNIIPYSLVDHIHEKEISAQLGSEIAFIPHVAVWFQGIHHTISIPLNRTMTSRDIRNIYQDRYAGEKLVKVVGESPLVKNISGKHGVEIGGFAVHSSGKRVVVNATIDNLLKGAATQCLQNMNLALGYGEYEGIPY